MKASKYAVTITGSTPLLMHSDNLSWAEHMRRWQKNPSNTGESIPGDDRTPSWRWIGCLYADQNKVCIPADNLMTVLREGGKRTPTGRRGGTFKAQTQSGLVVNEASWPLLVSGRTIDMGEILSLTDEPDFEKHVAKAETLGFDLFVKRAKVGAAKHVRVRPRFDTWSAQGTITVFDEMITKEVLSNILTLAGAYAGLGDWRPSSPKAPGPFGKFTVELKEA